MRKPKHTSGGGRSRGRRVTPIRTRTLTPEHLGVLEEVIEREGVHGLVEVLCEEGIDPVRYVLWDATRWHRDYSPPAWRNRATEEQKRVGWEMAVRIEKILCTVLHEAHEREVEETINTLSEGPKGFYKSYLD